MTTDDLIAVSEKYPTWMKSTYLNVGAGDQRAILRGAYKNFVFLCHNNMGSESWLGQQVGTAIFSALLDEIAEDVHGCYLMRRPITRRSLSGQSVEWEWGALSIEHGGTLYRESHPTKLEALLSL